MTAVQVPGYRQLEPVGHGGVGDVYRAIRTATGSVVAIKVLREVTDESAAWRRCRRELTALLALGGHPHVVAVLDVVAVGSNPALVMEYAPNGSVADARARGGAAPGAGLVARYGAQAAAALAAAHARGIVHRDVKPHNLLLDAAGDVKLCDFGIAAIACSPEFRNATASVSLRFASPEDLEGDATVGPPSDVYSLGATLLWLAHGEHLDLRDRLVPWFPQPSDDRATVALDAVLTECLRPSPADRPTATDLLALLEPLAEPHVSADIGGATAPAGVPIPQLPPDTLPRPVPGHRPPAPHAPPRPSPARPRPHRRRALVGVVGLLAAGAAWWPGAHRTARPDVAHVIARPVGLVTVTAVGWPSGPAGECLVQLAGRGALEPVDCNAAHDLERVGGGELPHPPDAAFVQADVDAAVDTACAAKARQHAGPARLATGLSVAVSRPSAAGWAAGDRSYRCFVGVPDQRLTGSAARG